MASTQPRLKNFILDVDGVMTTGHLLYTSSGKHMKIFGSDDNDALSLLRNKLNIAFVTGDKKGFDISNKRIHKDMGFRLDLVSTCDRVSWLESQYDLNETIYMGDGIFDSMVFEKVAYSIAPANAFEKTKKTANFVTNKGGGSGAVAEACAHILSKYFQIKDIGSLVSNNVEIGAWQKK